MISIHAEHVLLEAFKPSSGFTRPVDDIARRLKREETREIFEALVEYYEETHEKKPE